LRDEEALKLGRAWDGIPLAIRWAVARSKNVSELLRQAELPASQRLQGEQLLEFSFRRVFENLSQAERSVLETLSVLEQPMPTEALVAGAGSPDTQVLDAADELVDDGLVQRVFDADRNDYCFAILPITRAFTRHDLQRRPAISKDIQRRLTKWYEATDIADLDERLVVREVRSGRNSDDSALVELAQTAERRGDLDGAEKLYRQALARNPRSWRAARTAAEFHRHRRNNAIEALALYEVAGGNAPKRGSERALIFREWGLLLRDSGKPDSVARAEEKFAVAYVENPADPVTLYALATCFDRRGAYRKVIELLEPIAATKNERARKQTLPILLKAYERTHEMLKAAELRRKIS
jgi:tetratricopeptide (TPR) repeat protein